MREAILDSSRMGSLLYHVTRRGIKIPCLGVEWMEAEWNEWKLVLAIGTFYEEISRVWWDYCRVC